MKNTSMLLHQLCFIYSLILFSPPDSRKVKWQDSSDAKFLYIHYLGFSNVSILFRDSIVVKSRQLTVSNIIIWSPDFIKISIIIFPLSFCGSVYHRGSVIRRSLIMPVFFQLKQFHSLSGLLAFQQDWVSNFIECTSMPVCMIVVLMVSTFG